MPYNGIFKYTMIISSSYTAAPRFYRLTPPPLAGDQPRATWPHGRKDPGKAPAPISGKTKGPARHRHGKNRITWTENAWAPSARPADSSLESPGRKKDGNKISRPRPDGPANGKQEEARKTIWTLPEISRNGKAGKQEEGKGPAARLHLPYMAKRPPS